MPIQIHWSFTFIAYSNVYGNKSNNENSKVAWFTLYDPLIVDFIYSFIICHAIKAQDRPEPYIFEFWILAHIIHPFLLHLTAHMLLIKKPNKFQSQHFYREFMYSNSDLASYSHTVSIQKVSCWRLHLEANNNIMHNKTNCWTNIHIWTFMLWSIKKFSEWLDVGTFWGLDILCESIDSQLFDISIIAMLFYHCKRDVLTCFFFSIRLGILHESRNWHQNVAIIS